MHRVDPYYLTYLAKKKNNPKLILQARKINEGMSNYHAKKILHGLKKSKKYKILICGLLLKLIVLILEIQEFLNFTQN